MLLFAEAQNVEWLFAARILQGVATGIAMGAISAALLDLQPEDNPRLGALDGRRGAALRPRRRGAGRPGFLVQYAPEPTRLVYWLLLGGFAPRDRDRDGRPGDGPRRRLVVPVRMRPRVAVPTALRTPFVAAIPCLVATWALGGLVLSLGPSLTAGVLGDTSHVAGGLPIFVMAGISAAGLGVASRRPTRAPPPAAASSP